MVGRRVGNCVGWADVGTTVGVEELYCEMFVGAKVGISVVHSLHVIGQAALIIAPRFRSVQSKTSCAQEAGLPSINIPVTALSAQSVGAIVGSAVGSSVGMRELN